MLIKTFNEFLNEKYKFTIKHSDIHAEKEVITYDEWEDKNDNRDYDDEVLALAKGFEISPKYVLGNSEYTINDACANYIDENFSIDIIGKKFFVKDEADTDEIIRDIFDNTYNDISNIISDFSAEEIADCLDYASSKALDDAVRNKLEKEAEDLYDDNSSGSYENCLIEDLFNDGILTNDDFGTDDNDEVNYEDCTLLKDDLIEKWVDNKADSYCTSTSEIVNYLDDDFFNMLENNELSIDEGNLYTNFCQSHNPYDLDERIILNNILVNNTYYNVFME